MLINERELILEEEWLIVRNSGEIPEIALHSTVEYLCNDVEGPQFILVAEELAGLYTAVQERYLEIILRDLTPSNRTLSFYRGVQRAIINWQRLQQFCGRVQRECDIFIATVSQAVVELVVVECKEREARESEASGFNCTSDDLCSFLQSLNVAVTELPTDWQDLCNIE